MRLLGTTITVHRGEVFTLSRTVINKDGSPYVLSSKLVNPFLLLTVSSNSYRLNGDWVKNYWLDIRDFPKFDYLIPVYIETLLEPPEILNALYYTMDEFGNKEYYMYIDGNYVSYRFKFAKLFINSDTAEWIESVYQYQIRLVDGTLMDVWLKGLFEGLYPDKPIPGDNIKLFNQINLLRPDLLIGIDPNAALVNFTTKSTLLSPARLVVKSSIGG